MIPIAIVEGLQLATTVLEEYQYVVSDDLPSGRWALTTGETGSASISGLFQR